MSSTSILGLPVAIGLDGQEWVPLVQGSTTKRAQSGLIGAVGLASVLPGAIEFTIDAAGAAIPPQTWGYLTVPFDATLTSATLLGDTTGSIVVDVWKCTYAEYDAPTTPSAANSITGAATPSITAANKYQTTNLSAWTTTTLGEGDVLAFNVPSQATAISKVTLSLGLIRVVSS